MMGALPLELFEPLPYFTNRLTLYLREIGDIILEFDGLPRRKILAQECLGRPSQVVNELAFEFKSQDLALSFKEKGNSLN